MKAPTMQTIATTNAPRRRWSAASVAVLVLFWAVLQLGGLFSPGLLDDVDSIYIQIAREMLQRHDFVTPTIDGIRFFDKPPLMYWMAAASMKVFGVHDWAARLPLALGVLALLLATYALGIRLYAFLSPARPDRAGFYAALALATSIGPYLYTRFYIPDILIALWMTVAVHLLLAALDRIDTGRSAREPMAWFGVVLALSMLTKGLIGVIFPVGFALLFLFLTRRLRDLHCLHVPLATAAFAAVALPWHVLAALRNPAIAMPAGVGLPARAGWAWFYLYNEHVARFLGRRIPHDYGQVPVPLFWLLLVLWLVPWAAFLPAAVWDAVKTLRQRAFLENVRFDSDADAPFAAMTASSPARTAAMATMLWAGLVLGFFTISSRQEYYHLPALPALALLAGALLAAADVQRGRAWSQARSAALWLLVPFGVLLALACGYFAAVALKPAAGADLASVLASNPEMYNLSLGHVFDLTSTAMGFFRGPLLAVALCGVALGPMAYFVRRGGRTFEANLLVAVAMSGILLAAHAGLTRFYPTLGSKDLALQIEAVRRPGDLILIDGELTAGSTLLFYTGADAAPVHLVNGRVNGPWFGSFWPDAPHIFEDDASLQKLWAGPQRVFLLTYQPTTRTAALAGHAPVHTLAASGGKTVLSNQP